MTHPISRRLRPLVPCAVAVLMSLLGACNVVAPAGDDPTRYFVLSDPVAASVPAPAAGAVRIGLREVKLESYLKKREMVVRTGENEVEFRDFRRWAEALDSGISRIVRQRMLEAPEVAQVYLAPFPPDQPHDYDVAIDVRRCEGSVSSSGGFAASFSAVVEVTTTGDNPRLVSRKLFKAPDAAWDGRDFDRLASLLSADVYALAQDILAGMPPRT